MSVLCDDPEYYAGEDIIAAVKQINANFTDRGLEPIVVLIISFIGYLKLFFSLRKCKKVQMNQIITGR
jgi:hypothetical protein